MKLLGLLFVVSNLFLAGCAATAPPSELIFARQAYLTVSTGQAQQLVPAEVRKAEVALALAEKSYQDEPRSFMTRDLSYIAGRKAHLAQALSVTAAGNAATAAAKTSLEATQAEIATTAQVNLAASERAGKEKSDQLAIEQAARREAETRAAAAQADLVKLAGAKEEARGLVLTLSGSVLFASGRSELLPIARERLSQVATALMVTKERRLTVEGHTDSQGTTGHNQILSQKRADVVRAYLISCGYSGDLVIASGIGETRPVADNGSSEGRANNRRVEIIVDRPVVQK
jgi:outer membrane protein OmpA-like peptidoglycan-associated protein